MADTNAKKPWRKCPETELSVIDGALAKLSLKRHGSVLDGACFFWAVRRIRLACKAPERTVTELRRLAADLLATDIFGLTYAQLPEPAEVDPKKVKVWKASIFAGRVIAAIDNPEGPDEAASETTQLKLLLNYVRAFGRPTQYVDVDVGCPLIAELFGVQVNCMLVAGPDDSPEFSIVRYPPALKTPARSRKRPRAYMCKDDDASAYNIVYINFDRHYEPALPLSVERLTPPSPPPVTALPLEVASPPSPLRTTPVTSALPWPQEWAPVAQARPVDTEPFPLPFVLYDGRTRAKVGAFAHVDGTNMYSYTATDADKRKAPFECILHTPNVGDDVTFAYAIGGPDRFGSLGLMVAGEDTLSFTLGPDVTSVWLFRGGCRLHAITKLMEMFPAPVVPRGSSSSGGSSSDINKTN